MKEFLTDSIRFVHPVGVKGWITFVWRFPGAYLRYRRVMKPFRPADGKGA